MIPLGRWMAEFAPLLNRCIDEHEKEARNSLCDGRSKSATDVRSVLAGDDGVRITRSAGDPRPAPETCLSPSTRGSSWTAPWS